MQLNAFSDNILQDRFVITLLSLLNMFGFWQIQIEQTEFATLLFKYFIRQFLFKVINAT